jgi:hypothetical protein
MIEEQKACCFVKLITSSSDKTIIKSSRYLTPKKKIWFLLGQLAHTNFDDEGFGF